MIREIQAGGEGRAGQARAEGCAVEPPIGRD
jgi:hypothetical protein